MNNTRKLYAGDVVRIINPANLHGLAGGIHTPHLQLGTERIVRDVVLFSGEINIVVFEVENQEASFKYKYARCNVEPVLTPSGKVKRIRAPRGKPWNVKPYPEVAGAPAVKDTRTPEQVRADAKKKFAEAIENGSGVSQWLRRGVHGWSQRVAAACHAELRGDGAIYEMYEGIAGVYKKLNDDGKEEYRRWFDYLVNRSPWKDVYLTKDLDDALVNHVQINVALASQVVMGAITILRTGHEYPSIRRQFCDLVDKGVPEFAAMASQSFISLRRDEYYIGGCNTNHTVFDSMMSPEQILTFMVKGYSERVLKINRFENTRSIPTYWSFGIFDGIVENRRGYDPKTLDWVEPVQVGMAKTSKINLEKFIEYANKVKEKAQ